MFNILILALATTQENVNMNHQQRTQHTQHNTVIDAKIVDLKQVNDIILI